MERNILILGASSDLATGLIQRIAGGYDRIFAHYHSSADKLLKLQKSVPCRMDLLRADFTSEDETRKLMDEVSGSGAVITHILHCPSARLKNERFKNSTWADQELMLDTQLRSLYYAANCFVPQMAKQRYGKVVMVLSSYTVGTPPAFSSNYVTAKYAMLGLVKALAAEYADRSVQINAVSPSMMDTKFLQDTPHLVVEKNAATHPLKRNATVEDVLPVIEFLLSDQSGFITGQNILISGGSII